MAPQGRIGEGLIWKWDHLEWLTRDEYEFLMRHTLPPNWSIISIPDDPKVRAAFARL
jgi:hypothetical protein